MRAAANVYLDRLAARLADFVDLGGATLDGRGTATLVANRTPNGEFTAEGTIELKQFAFTERDGKGLSEPQLRVELSASGKSVNSDPLSIATATATLTAGPTSFISNCWSQSRTWKNSRPGNSMRLTGDLGRWWARVGLFVRLPKHYLLGGAARANGTIRFAKDTIAVDRLTLDLKDARFRGAGLDLDEPQMNAVADLNIDRKTGRMAFEQFTINSAPLTVSSGKLVIQAPDQGELVVEGGGPAVTNLNRLGKTLKLYTDPRGPASLRGKGTGPIQFRYSAGTTTFGGMLDFVNFSAGLPSAPDWSEPNLRLEADGSYAESSDTLAFKVARIERPGLALSLPSTISKLGTTADVNMNGMLTYDLAVLTPALRDTFGGNFKGQGRGSSPVTITGSLAPPAEPGSKSQPGPLATLNADMQIGWDSLRAYGFDVGRGELRGKLEKGVGRMNPITATFGGGKVTLHPTLYLEPCPAN